MHYRCDCKMLQTTTENSMAVPQKIKSRTSKGPAIPLLDIY